MIWEDPPDTARPGRWGWIAAFIAELKAHPGKWAQLVGPDGTNEFTSSTRGVFKKAGCEIKQTTKDVARNGYARMWVRWPDDVT